MKISILVTILLASRALAAPLARIAISPDSKSFILQPSGQPFIPWGLNYDRDFKMRLIEDYWDNEWETIVRDFAEMRRLGANVVRVHLQFPKFMDAPGKANVEALDRLEKLVDLAESQGLYLDLTGLGCYRLKDVPAWYDALSDQDHWDQQAAFWEAVAGRCAGHAGVLAYDLMNEPVVPGEARAPGKWVLEADLGGFHYVQFLVLDPAGRKREDIWKAWAGRMVAAIRKHDATRPITIGLLPLMGNADLVALASELDYISVHYYPQSGKLDDGVKLIQAFAVGKPLVIEEIFPLSCSPAELREFITRTRGTACGWVGFYWGKDVEQLKKSNDIGDKLLLGWLELFQSMAGEIERVK